MGARAAVLPNLKWNHSLHGPSHCMKSHDVARGCTQGSSFQIEALSSGGQSVGHLPGTFRCRRRGRGTDSKLSQSHVRASSKSGCRRPLQQQGNEGRRAAAAAAIVTYPAALPAPGLHPAANTSSSHLPRQKRSNIATHIKKRERLF